jgi:hypothetical protein
VLTGPTAAEFAQLVDVGPCVQLFSRWCGFVGEKRERLTVQPALRRRSVAFLSTKACGVTESGISAADLSIFRRPVGQGRLRR